MTITTLSKQAGRNYSQTGLGMGLILTFRRTKKASVVAAIQYWWRAGRTIP